MHEQTNTDGLTYFISTKHEILVVSLVGALTKPNQEVLQHCIEDLEKAAARHVIVNLHDVPAIDKILVPDFMKLQLVVRKKPADLRLCFMSPKIKMFLDDAGVIRPAEVSPNLKAALVSLPLRKVA